MPVADIETLIDRADLDGLVHAVDALCETRSWSELLRTRDLCRAATLSGRQVWPIATLCEYRLALHAPARWACRVVDDQASRFSIGPLTEVVAQNHPWSDLREELAPGPHREIVAHERAIRGDVIDETLSASPVLELPFHVCEWEPDYPVAEYSDDGIVAPCPTDQWRLEWSRVSAETEPVEEILDDETAAALRDLVEPWTAASAGRARCITVEGDLDALVASLSRPAVGAARLTPQQALQWIAWCGSSSGSHGRRRGAAAGRFGTWWLLAVLADLHREWDRLRDQGALCDELGRACEALQWYAIDLGEHHSYELSLVAHDAEENLTFGLFAFDDPM